MLSKIHWWSVIIGIIFAMFVWPMVSGFLAKGRASQSTRTA